MAKKITIDDLAAMTQRGFLEMGKEMGKGFQDIKETMQIMMEELRTTHADVQYLRSATDMIVRSDAAQDAEIRDLTARVYRLEQKAGLAKK